MACRCPLLIFFLPLSSLPRALGVTLEEIPRQTPYLRAPEQKPLPVTQPSRLKDGLVWAGKPGHNQDAARSIPLQELAPILKTPGVDFYSLQQVVPASDE